MSAFKRICLFSDGSGCDPESRNPSNIVHLTERIKPLSQSKTIQQVHYDPGVGTQNALDFFFGFVFGAGVTTNIKQLYTALALNYNPGDEIYLFGFSRGAFTVRSLANLIYTSGLVRRSGLQYVEEAFELYESKAGADSKQAQEFRKEHGDRVDIKAIVCFDTVGDLGAPVTLPGPFGKLFGDFSFHDMGLKSNVEHAIHAVSIDDDRRKFLPDLMEEVREGQVTEMYMAGYHTGVGGGGYQERYLANMAMRFAVEELRKRGCGLEFDEDGMGGEYVDVEVKSSFSEIYKLVKVLTGSAVREVAGLDKVHETALRRYCRVAEWKPKALERFKEEILKRREEFL